MPAGHSADARFCVVGLVHMPHEFTPSPTEPEAQPAAARSGGRPPGKPVGTDLLDPPAPSDARSTRNPLRVLALVLLFGLAAALAAWMLGKF